jgi:DNA-binding MarR family transcriptional regulator
VFLSEITRAYQQEGIEFEASWFPVFYLLAEHDELSIKDLSEQMEVSHPAASQLVAGLKNKGLLQSITSTADGRKQLVTLTSQGKILLENVRPVWDAILITMRQLTEDTPGTANLLLAITAMENALRSTRLSDQIIENIAKQLNPAGHE